MFQPHNQNQWKSTFDYVFLDHDKSFYLSDLKILEKQGLLSDQIKVIADNVIYPDYLIDYLEYLNIDNNNDKSPWSTRIERMPFERKGFETQYKQVPDGMSISVRK